MIAIDSILCPIDFSDFSRRALAYAVAVARTFDSTVTALHVSVVMPLVGVASYEGLGGPRPLLPPAESRERLLKELRHFVDDSEARDVNIDVRVSEAPGVHQEILAQASAVRADLVVMSTHGRSGFERLFLGSVTEKVLRTASCPVMTVPAGMADPGTRVRFARILCPVDFSEGSAVAFDYASALAQEADGQLTVLHVIEFLPVVQEPWVPTAAEVARMRSAMERDCAGRLTRTIPDSVREYCTVKELVTAGKPYREILRVAADEQADLVVMGVQGRGAVDLLLFGSTTHHVVREATCPVLAVRPQPRR